MISTLTIAWAVKQADQELASAAWLDEPSACARLGNRLKQAADIIDSWVLQAAGAGIYDITTQGMFTVPADRIYGLARLIDQVSVYTGCQYHMGIGVGVREAGQALQAAGRKQEPYAFFDETQAASDERVEEQETLDPEESESQDELSKARNDGNDHWMPAETSENPEQTSGGPQDPEGVASPQGGTEQEQVQAQGGQTAPEGGAQEEQAAPEDARAMVAKALVAIKAQAAAIHQLQANSPAAFEAVKNIIQALVVMAHQLGDAPDSMQKAETLWKRLRLPAPKVSPKKVAMKYPDAIASPTLAGTIKDGKVKVTPQDPKDGSPRPEGWNQARAGVVMGPHGSPVSSRNPNGE